MTQPDMNSLRLPDGRTLAFTFSGAPEGPPVVYFHGAPGSRLEGGRDSIFATELADAGIRVVAFDRPGYGGSSPRPDRRVIDIADDVLELLDHLAIERAALIGWSTGGPHALASGARHSDRVSAIGVIAGFAPILDQNVEGAGERELLELARTDQARLRHEVTSVAAIMREDPLAATMELLAGTLTDDDLLFAADPAVTGVMIASLREAARLDLAGYADDLIALRDDWGFALADVTAPVSILHGHNDLLVPVAHGRYLASHLNASYDEPEEGHLSVLRGFVHLATTLATTTNDGIWHESRRKAAR